MMTPFLNVIKLLKCIINKIIIVRVRLGFDQSIERCWPCRKTEHLKKSCLGNRCFVLIGAPSRGRYYILLGKYIIHNRWILFDENEYYNSYYHQGTVKLEKRQWLIRAETIIDRPPIKEFIKRQ